MVKSLISIRSLYMSFALLRGYEQHKGGSSVLNTT